MSNVLPPVRVNLGVPIYAAPANFFNIKSYLVCDLHWPQPMNSRHPASYNESLPSEPHFCAASPPAIPPHTTNSFTWCA